MASLDTSRRPFRRSSRIETVVWTSRTCRSTTAAPSSLRATSGTWWISARVAACRPSRPTSLPRSCTMRWFLPTTGTWAGWPNFTSVSLTLRLAPRESCRDRLNTVECGAFVALESCRRFCEARSATVVLRPFDFLPVRSSFVRRIVAAMPESVSAARRPTGIPATEQTLYLCGRSVSYSLMSRARRVTFFRFQACSNVPWFQFCPPSFFSCE